MRPACLSFWRCCDALAALAPVIAESWSTLRSPWASSSSSSSRRGLDSAFPMRASWAKTSRFGEFIDIDRIPRIQYSIDRLNIVIHALAPVLLHGSRHPPRTADPLQFLPRGLRGHGAV